MDADAETCVPSHQDHRPVVWSWWLGTAGVAIIRISGDCTAESKPAEPVHLSHDLIRDAATDVVKVAVNPIRCSSRQGFFHVLGFVVDGDVETELVGHPIALCFAASDSNYPSTSHFGQLPGDRSHGTSAARDDKGFACGWFADLSGSDPSGVTFDILSHRKQPWVSVSIKLYVYDRIPHHQEECGC